MTVMTVTDVSGSAAIKRRLMHSLDLASSGKQQRQQQQQQCAAVVDMNALPRRRDHYTRRRQHCLMHLWDRRCHDGVLLRSTRYSSRT